MFNFSKSGRVALAVVVLFALRAKAEPEGRITQSFDASWHFLKSDAAGAELPSFDDSHWRLVDVPHDWAIEGPIAQTNISGKHGAFLPSGVSWYRKSFAAPESWRSRRVSIEFDGVMANSEVWINGQPLGKRPNGYVSFSHELTGHLKFGPGESNVLAVRTDTSVQPASRWSAGAGIYRHVRLIATDPVHLARWSVFISTPRISAQKAIVHVTATAVNQSEAAQETIFKTTLLDAGGATAGEAEIPQTLPPGSQAVLTLEIPVANPRHWDVTNPCLYQAHTTISTSGKRLDDQTTPFGLRETRWEPATGFWLNGRNLKIKGFCVHQDGGALGAAVPLAVWERRLQILRQIGCNAIRTSHNPPAPEFLDLCDRMGFLVMHEVFDAWTISKRDADDSRFFKDWWERDLGDTLLRDRNHPSIIIYSAGNEIRDLFAPGSQGLDWFKRLREVYHTIDPTRPVTLAASDPALSGFFTNGLADAQDVVGQNYDDDELVAERRKHPGWKIISTEDFINRKAWVTVRGSPALAGQFVWCAFDYLGESAGWPEICFDYGLFDRTGQPYAWARERESYWSEKPMVQLVRREKDLIPRHGVKGVTGRFADWTPHYPDYKTARILIFGNCQEVELFLNGKSLGTHPFAPDATPVALEFPFEPGSIIAQGKNNGQVVCREELRTAGKPSRLDLSPDRTSLSPNWEDAASIVIRVVDKNGAQLPMADDLISFSITGPGKIVGVDSGDLSTHESFQAPSHRAFNGQCLAIIQATADSGEIIFTASASGLTSASITLPVHPFTH